MLGRGREVRLPVELLRAYRFSRGRSRREREDVLSASRAAGILSYTSFHFSCVAISLAIPKICCPYPAANVFASPTTSTISASSSFSALRNFSHSSSPICPRWSSVVNAALASRTDQMSRTSSMARRRRAAIRIGWGGAGSRERREMYRSRDLCWGNQGSAAGWSARGGLARLRRREGRERTELSFAVDLGEEPEGAGEEAQVRGGDPDGETHGC